jgi:hypothetical protein
MTPHFPLHELVCKCGCGLASFHPEFLDKLEALRDLYDAPMKLSSACRCSAHNAKVSPLAPLRSFHIGDRETRPGVKGTLAVDVVVEASAKGKLFALAWSRGWSIGWNRSFLHIDRRVDIGMPQITFEY